MPEQQPLALEKPVVPPVVPAEAVPTDGQTPPAGEAPATPQGAETPPTTDQDQEKQRSSRRFERRLDKAYRRAAEAQARAELAEKQLAEFRSKSSPSDPGAPKLEDFKDIEEYAAAREKHASEKAVKELTSKQQAESRKQYETKLVEAWEAKAERGIAKYDDFDETVGELKPTSPWAVAVMDADNGEDIAHYLGKHLKEAERIASLSPASQIREIGKLEAKLAAEPPKPKTPSKAPAPITPLSGAAPVATDVPSEGDDYATWFKKRQKQVHGKR